MDVVNKVSYVKSKENEIAFVEGKFCFTKESLKEFLGVSAKRSKKRVVQKEPRPAASQEFYFWFLKEKRFKGYSKTNWSRSRLAITCLRFFGLRASEAGLLSLGELESLQEASVLNVYQSKVNSYRRVLVLEEMRLVLREHHKEHLSCLLAAHGGDSSVCLSASCKGKTKGLAQNSRDWLSGLNIILKGIAKKHGLKGITTRTRLSYKLYNASAH